jgi:hypothetical protein
MGTWQQDWPISPGDDPLRLLPQSGEVSGLECCDRLADGIDGVFRTEVEAQYAGWPPGSTTDGARVDICLRSGSDSLEVMGLMYIDFSGDVFPFLALIERTKPSLSLVGFIGLVDEGTGHPPRLPSGGMINPVRMIDRTTLTPELISGRLASPIPWTKVLERSWAT